MYMERQTFFLKKAFLPLFHKPPNCVIYTYIYIEIFTGSGVLTQSPNLMQMSMGSGVPYLPAQSPNLMQLLSQINPLWRCPREKVGGAKRSSRTGQCLPLRTAPPLPSPPSLPPPWFVLPIASVMISLKTNKILKETFQIGLIFKFVIFYAS